MQTLFKIELIHGSGMDINKLDIKNVDLKIQKKVDIEDLPKITTKNLKKEKKKA